MARGKGRVRGVRGGEAAWWWWWRGGVVVQERRGGGGVARGSVRGASVGAGRGGQRCVTLFLAR